MLSSAYCAHPNYYLSSSGTRRGRRYFNGDWACRPCACYAGYAAAKCSHFDYCLRCWFCSHLPSCSRSLPAGLSWVASFGSVFCFELESLRWSFCWIMAPNRTEHGRRARPCSDRSRWCGRRPYSFISSIIRCYLSLCCYRFHFYLGHPI